MMQLHPAIQAHINKKWPGKVVKIEETPYWSRVRFQFTLAGVLAVGSRQAFSYGQSDPLTTAGFLAAYGNATAGDTNLQKRGETLLGADVFVEGVNAFMTPFSDPVLAARVIEECDCTWTTDGQRFQPLARLEMIPAGGGLVGGGQSAIKEPPLDTAGIVDGGPGASVQFANNGVAARGNFFPMGSPVLWSGERNADSFFRINLNIGRQITEAPTALRAGGAGVLPYNPPANQGDRGTYVDFIISLKCLAVSLPSANG